MQELWKKYTVPIVVTGTGLLVAFILGVAPLFDRDAPADPETSVAAAISPAQIGAGDDLTALEATLMAQAQALDSLSNRINTLEKGVGRLNGRLAEHVARVDAMADLPARLGALETQVRTLNVAVPRMNFKLVEQNATLEELSGVRGEVTKIDAQVRVLNAAVPRLHGRVQSLRERVER